MKKFTIAAVAILVVALLGLAACGSSSGSKDLSNSKYVGTWKATAMQLKGETGEMTAEFTLTLKGDGTGQYYSKDEDGTEEKTDVKWELTNNGFKTTGDTKLTFTDDGNNIKTKIIGVDLIFVKQA